MNLKSIAIVAMMIAATIGFAAATCNITEPAYTALFDLYNSTNGDSWRWPRDLSNAAKWHFPAPLNEPCTWFGITCLDDPLMGTCDIVELNLTRRELIGRIPDSLSGLSKLDMLDLSQNLLVGYFPVGIANISHVKYLRIDSNEFLGQLPDYISRLQRIQFLHMDRNLFSGTLPSAMSAWTDIRVLNIGHNKLRQDQFPSVLTTLSTLYSLDIAVNRINGTIPYSICNLRNLTNLQIYSNFFQNTLPSNISCLQELQTFTLNKNLFTGPLPAEIGNMTNLISLQLDGNRFSQRIPTELNRLTQLQALVIAENFFTGMIPDEIYVLPNLEYFLADRNSFTGVLPSKYSASLISLDVSRNSLVGTIPSAVLNMTKVQELVFYSNLFTGTIPNFKSLKHLGYLYLNNNSFHGTLSSESFPKDMNQLSLSRNSFHGTLPVSLFLASSLHQLTVAYNYLTGQLPSGNDINVNTTLYLLDISSNSISGTIPTSFTKMTDLIQLHASGNKLSGNIPSSIHQMYRLSEIELSSNYLSDEIPEELGLIPRINFLYLDDNYLSGNIPHTMLSTRRIRSLNLSTNFFDGQIQFYPLPETNWTTDKSNGTLRYIDLSHNQLTGSIPTFLFTMNPKLEQISLSGNCFHGYLPEEICLARELRTLLMDDMAAGDRCDRSESSKIFHYYGFLKGSIPDCVWKMSTLFTLHMSGNALTGHLHEIHHLRNITDLTISSNVLTGTLPLSLQHHTFLQLILSNNKLSGTLQSDFAAPQHMIALNMSSNRFSGNIPSSFQDIESIDILQGNLFQCNSPPSNDINANNYVCGSDDLSTSIIAFTVMFSVSLVLVLVAIKKQFIVFNSYQASHNAHEYDVMKYTYDIVKTGMIVACIGMVPLIFYAVVKHLDQKNLQFSTHSFQYMWMFSIAYMHGSLPTVFLILLVVITLAISIHRIFHYRKIENDDYDEFEWTFDNVKHVLKDSIVPTLLQTFNIIVISAVNSFYVYLVVQKYDYQVLSGTQFAIAAFKVAWSMIYIPWMITIISSSMSSLHALRHELFANLYNFLICPGLACMATDVNCLYYSIVGLPQVEVSYIGVIDQCFTATIDFRFFEYTQLLCKPHPAVVDQLFNSPWLYSYQCGSTVISNYIPIMVYTYAIVGVAIPIIKLMILTMDPEFIMKYVNLNVAVQLSGFVFFALDVELIKTHNHARPVIDSQYGLSRLSMNPSIAVNSTAETVVATNASPINQKQIGSVKSSTRCLDSDELLALCKKPSLMRIEGFVSLELRHLVVMLTFGLGCPLLCIIVCWTMFVEWFVIRLQIGRYLLIMTSFDHQSFAIRRVEETFSKDFRDLVTRCLSMTVMTVVSFWSLFIFDMVADVYGNISGAIAIVVFAVFSFILCASLHMNREVVSSGIKNITRLSSMFRRTSFGRLSGYKNDGAEDFNRSSIEILSVDSMHELTVNNSIINAGGQPYQLNNNNNNNNSNLDEYGSSFQGGSSHKNSSSFKGNSFRASAFKSSLRSSYLTNPFVSNSHVNNSNQNNHVNVNTSVTVVTDNDKIQSDNRNNANRVTNNPMQSPSESPPAF